MQVRHNFPDLVSVYLMTHDSNALILVFALFFGQYGSRFLVDVFLIAREKICMFTRLKRQ